MPRASLLLLVPLLALSRGGALAAKKQYDPFRVPREQFRSTIKTIAMRSCLRVPRDLATREQVLAEFDSLIANRLGAAGFAVVPAREADAIERRLTDSLGGCSTPRPGSWTPSRPA